MKEQGDGEAGYQLYHQESGKLVRVASGTVEENANVIPFARNMGSY
jgi:hypothetical protein